MTEKIKKLLCELEIENYLINEEEVEECELYFVRRRLDQKRGKHTHKATVRVYRDSRDMTLRGMSEVLIFSDMSDGEIKDRLASAYRAAEYSLCPAYPLCPPSKEHSRMLDTEEKDLDLMAQRYAEAVFKYDTEENTYVNCAEIFCKKTRIRTSNSLGVDVCELEYRSDGELVVSSREGEDVELFDYFSYTGDGYEALSKKVKGLLSAVRDRAGAERSLSAGEYDLIIEGDACRELFGYYLWKADAKNIHTGYSDSKLRDRLCPVGGVADCITALATRRFDKEGIPGKDTPVIRNGVLASYIGDMRFCSYIGAEPTGVLERISVNVGSTPLSEMKKKPYLHVVSFSDFQFDPLDGYFGGEIRLAYLFDGESVRAVTGGSVSSNISKLDSAVSSSDMYESYTYRGPLALKIKDVCVSG